ncbi:MAG: transposase, partial [Clostridia bacterium]|nr:transposase [Clostridia bacterium]
DIVLSSYGKIVDETINNISKIYPSICVDQYVIMPDHIHLLVRILSDEHGRPMVAPTMSRLVQQMKGYATKRIGVSIWQKLFFDHIIRNREDYEEHLRYIYENPIHWQFDKLYTEESGGL